jgi:hypothetical protein
MKNKIIYCFDLDGTICYTPEKLYKDAIPYVDVIGKINELYDGGHYIKIYTARGGTSGVNYHDLNITQLKNWGVKYHELRFGKPVYDVFIDDKNLNSLDWLDE